MAEKFVVFTGALIYNEAGEILVGLRNQTDTDAPGIYAYPGGKMEFDENDIDKNMNNILDSVEKNIKKEVMEEVGVEIDNFQYVNSHNFTKANGDRVVALVFLARLAGKIPTPDMIEITECKWIKETEIDALNTLPVVKMIIKLGFDALRNRQYHQHMEVAGIVINDKNEFLVLKEANSGHYVFPHGNVENLPGRTWEILEKNLMRNIFSLTGVEVSDGMIPFTDREFMGKDGFEKIIQFFICKYSGGTPITADPFVYTEAKWMTIEQMQEKDFKPLVYSVFKKAFEFINRINN
jgi:ADP-ribose pyrophosphatase YjhB (NUDIX family)